jgi:hypothetical protein
MCLEKVLTEEPPISEDRSGSPDAVSKISSELARYRVPISRAFSAAVALCLILPLGLTAYPRHGVVSAVDEHRAPVPFPSPILLLDATNDFAVELNRWFDDRVGLRDLFIRTKNQIDYTVFNTSRKVYVGRDGWLFMHKTTDSRLMLEHLGAGQLHELEEAFLALASLLQRKNIHLIVIGYPDKSMLYPEKLPTQAPMIARGGNYDELRQFLAQQSALTFIDADDILNRVKRDTDEPVFYKTDVHVGLVGQIQVVKAIVDVIARSESRTDIHWHETLDLERADWSSGNEARFLSLLSPVHEQITYAVAGYAIGHDEPDGHWTVPDRRAIDEVGDGNGLPFDFEFDSAPRLCDDRLPGTVVFGNSFSDHYWTLGLHRYFCFIRRSRTPISRLPAFVDATPPGTKYFIFQYLAAYLPDDGPWLK